MYTIREDLQRELDEIRAQGLYKSERIITSPQGADIIVARPGGNGSGPREVINFCANNYLGLGGRQELVDAAK